MVSINEKDFQQFAEYVKAHYGIHFRKEKISLIEGRLGTLIEKLNFSSLSEYLDYVIKDKSGAALSQMLDKITTNYTFFMREEEHFKYFKETVLPYLTSTVRDKDLRIWSAACATGEEPYTLAMIIDEFFGAEKRLWDTKILASDISSAALAAAKTGIYEKERLSEVPPYWINKYFNETDDNKYIISEKIRNEVIFKKINLMDKVFPFKKKMHVILCRNVMIYFDNQTRDSVVEKLYDVTEPGGFLFIGHSEALNREKTRFKYVMPAVYRKE